MTVNVTAEISIPTIQAEAYRATIIPDGYYKIEGTTEIIENGTHNVGNYEFAEVNVPERKEEQEKAVNITKNGTTEIFPDKNKALSKATVNVNVPIPEGYIKPEGSMDINENGTFDVREFAKAFVNVPTSAGGGGLAYDMGTFVLDTDTRDVKIKIPHNLGKVPRMIVVWTDDFAGITEPPYPTTDSHLGFVWFDKFMGIPQQLTSAVDSNAPFCSLFTMAKNTVKARWQGPNSSAYGLVWLPTDTEFNCTYNGISTYWRAGVVYKYFVSEGFW